jgi:hypothetical protein
MYNTTAKCSTIKAAGSLHLKFNGAEDFLLKKVGNFVFMQGVGYELQTCASKSA